ncbi:MULTISPECIES: lipopolysaccharide biosynthesis protein [unclassified Aeromonas]|uniref:lipopolysaccharide biosynthesis protein n=1 Tax=unclassified Aeromonas TaxID=257493 RepID=UPI0022E28BC9|nr:MULTISPECIES: hypothetical protein [unclassified Aeromonas]
MNRNVFKSFVKLLSGNAFASFVALVNLSFISNKIGLSGFGVFIICQTSYTLVEQIFNIRGWQHYISSKINDLDSLRLLFGINNVINILAFISSLAALGLLYFNKWISIDDAMYCLIYISLILFRNYDSAYVALRNAERYGVLSSLNVLLAVTRLALTYGLSLYDSLTLVKVIYIYVATEACYYFLMNFFSIKMAGNYICFIRHHSRDIIINGFKLNLSTIFDLPVSTLDTYIVQYYFGSESLGLYKLVKKYISILGRVVSPLNQVLFPEIVKSDSESQKKIMFRTIIITLSVCLILSIFLYVAIFTLKLSFFDSIRISNYLNTEVLFVCLISIEAFSLSFSILNFMLIAKHKYTKNSMAILMSNAVFISMFICISAMKDNLVFAAVISSFIQVITLVAYRGSIILKNDCKVL